MSRLASTAMASALCFISHAQLTQDWVMDQLQTYSNTSYEIVNQYRINGSSMSYGANSMSFGMKHLEFCELKDTMSFLSSIATNVHETAHGLDSQIPYMKAKKGESIGDLNKTEGFYLSEFLSIQIKHPNNKMFPSMDVIGEIPESLRTFRFNTYMIAQPTLSTQCDGIYGLMDEFNAYYHGSKAIYDLFPLFKMVYPRTLCYYWASQFTSNADSYYEFDFFIKEYLLYAKTHHPALYVELKANGTFKMIYRTIRLNFSSMITQYEKKYDELLKSNKSHWSTSKHSDIHKVLSVQIESSRYADIKKDFLE